MLRGVPRKGERPHEMEPPACPRCSKTMVRRLSRAGMSLATSSMRSPMDRRTFIGVVTCGLIIDALVIRIRIAENSR